MSWILDAEPEIFLHIRFWGLMPQKVGIQFANETAKLSEYKTATFLEGGEHMISFRQFAFFLVFLLYFCQEREDGL